jgi:hypothetical protein
MKRPGMTSPSLETLEHRTCPSLSVSYSSTNLFITGTPNTTTTGVNPRSPGWFNGERLIRHRRGLPRQPRARGVRC